MTRTGKQWELVLYGGLFIAVFAGWIIWSMQSPWGVGIEFLGFTNSPTLKRSAVFRIANRSSIPVRVIPQGFRKANSPAQWKCSIDEVVEVRARENAILNVKMPPLAGTWRLEVYQVNTKPSNVRKAATWLARRMWSLPFDWATKVKLRLWIFGKLNAGQLGSSKPFNGDPQGLAEW